MELQNDELLKKIQRTELYILTEFDKVCRENGFVYFLDSGTALGAVRHGGFIPWDDDIDVGMPRKDYDRFMEIGQSLLPPNLFLQNMSTDKRYNRHFAKIRLEGTVFQEFDTLPFEHNGFFIDVFPFDNVPGGKMMACWRVKWMEEKLHAIQIHDREGDSVSPSRIRRLFANIVLMMPRRWVDAMKHSLPKLTSKRADKQTRFVTSYFWGMSRTKQYLFEREKMYPVKDMTFEGKTVMMMKDPDHYLAEMFGNYMQLPPEEKRVSHHLNGKVDFGEYDL